MNCQNARVLLLEDDPLIALDAEEMLMSLGARQVLVAHSLAAATATLEAGGVDMAVLDIRIGQERSDSFARRLADRGVPFILASGYGDPALAGEFAKVPWVGKPYAADALKAAFDALE
jgi:DNA-binding NtrC family response regulator